MESLEELRQFIEDAKSGRPFEPSVEQLQGYFRDLVSAASGPEGYESLCWEAGEWLLLLSGDLQSELFDSFGYEAISVALSSSIEHGTLPKGLSWFTSGFVPNDIDGDIMLGVLTHPAVRAALEKGLVSHGFTLSLDLLNPSDQHLGSATVRFLAHLHRAGMDRSVQLMWAARIVKHLSSDNPARNLAIQLVLEDLLQVGRHVNAFYWLRAFFADRRDDTTADLIFEAVSGVVKIALDMGESGYEILRRMSYENELLLLCYASKPTLVSLSLVMLWLAAAKAIPVRQESLSQGMDLLWDEYPNITLFLRKVSSWATAVLEQSSTTMKPCPLLDYLYAPVKRSRALNELLERIEWIPFYRGRRLPVDLWRECRDDVFRPILNSLQGVSDLDRLRTIMEQVSSLDAGDLVRSSNAYRGAQTYRQLEPDSQKMLEADFQDSIERLIHISELTFQTIMVSGFAYQMERWIDWAGLNQECTELLERWPSLADTVDTYFRPVLSGWEAAFSVLKE